MQAFWVPQWLQTSSSSRSGEISALMMKWRTARSSLPFRLRPASILPTALRPGQPRRSRSPQTGEFYFGAFGEC